MRRAGSITSMQVEIEGILEDCMASNENLIFKILITFYSPEFLMISPQVL